MSALLGHSRRLIDIIGVSVMSAWFVWSLWDGTHDLRLTIPFAVAIPLAPAISVYCRRRISGWSGGFIFGSYLITLFMYFSLALTWGLTKNLQVLCLFALWAAVTTPIALVFLAYTQRGMFRQKQLNSQMGERHKDRF